ncbi:hypothetical protein IFR35_24330 [Pseudomonas fluorescens]|uniref:hypothetical protein n=1 Tax=Pseudomonas TaxID=286 RepID=UPI000C14B239|nr:MULTISPECIES: hypothetical protein [Pseudomonas]KAE9651034.1 hypothetical protein EJD88_20300 [Pseudomonas sp. PB105]MBD8194512.1 hypothetical protein [Pseudomonas fluorescens]MBD8229354.1 hypothetical protein [Pseudomonas fluorescens]MBD8787339.1 hypothetical protein [Pseudomonas fluorescens]MBD8819674.1 hypothetical protein [Pseudomonas fluorescens]
MDFYLVFTIFIFAGALIGSGLSFYVEYTKLEALESYFSENKVVCDNKRFWGRNTHLDRVHRMILISQLLAMPKTHIKRGDVTEAELAAIPLSLKRWALWPINFGFIWFTSLIIWNVWYR